MIKLSEIKHKLNQINKIITGNDADFYADSRDGEKMDALSGLKAIWPIHEIYNGLIAILPASEIEYFNIDSSVRALNLIRFAGGCNGDPILIDFNFSVYYFDHDSCIDGSAINSIIHYGGIMKFLDEFPDIEKIPGDAESLRGRGN